MKKLSLVLALAGCVQPSLRTHATPKKDTCGDSKQEIRAWVVKKAELFWAAGDGVKIGSASDSTEVMTDGCLLYRGLALNLTSDGAGGFIGDAMFYAHNECGGAACFATFDLAPGR